MTNLAVLPTPITIAGSYREVLEASKAQSKGAKLILQNHRIVHRRLQAIGDYFAIRGQNGLVSYMPAGKTQGINDNGTWMKAGRQTIKPAKLLRKLFPDPIVNNTDLELFASIVKAGAEDAQITLHSGETAINEAYEEDENGLDTCMCREEVGEFYESAGAKVLIYRNAEGCAEGRAVVWQDVVMVSNIDEKPITLVDRVYGTERAIQGVLTWAREKGYYHKQYQDYHHKTEVVTLKGKASV